MLGIYRFLTCFFPLRWLSPFLNATFSGRTSNVIVEDDCEMLDGLVELIEKTARHTPWQSLCLQKSVCLATLLKFKGIPMTLNIGLRLDDGQHGSSLAAHAWVVCGARTFSWQVPCDDFAIVWSVTTPNDAHTRLANNNL